MATKFDQGLDLWQDFAETLIKIRDTQGDISRDDARIWDGYLHVWNNEHWEEVINAIGELLMRYPEFFESYHKKNIIEAAKIIDKNRSGHPRVLDTKYYKTPAWKLSMTLEEVWRAVRDSHMSKTSLRDTRNQFEKLYDLE